MQEMDWPQMDFPKVEVLILNVNSSDYFLPPFIENMSKLRALIVVNHGSSTAILRNTSVLTHLRNLRTLWLEKVVVPNLSHTTTPYKRMRKLSFILCKVNHSLDPSDTNLPSLFPNLIDLTIDHCDDLIELPSSICSIRSLQSLSITNCHSLKKLPLDMDGLANLEVLRTYACPNLRSLPSCLCKLVYLKYLDISQCVNLMKLPEGMGELVMLEKIDMRECSRLSSLPKSALRLSSLWCVICDEEVSYLWRDVVKARPSLHLQVVEKCFTLDWLE